MRFRLGDSYETSPKVTALALRTFLLVSGKPRRVRRELCARPHRNQKTLLFGCSQGVLPNERNERNERGRVESDGARKVNVQETIAILTRLSLSLSLSFSLEGRAASLESRRFKHDRRACFGRGKNACSRELVSKTASLRTDIRQGSRRLGKTSVSSDRCDFSLAFSLDAQDQSPIPTMDAVLEKETHTPRPSSRPNIRPL